MRALGTGLVVLGLALPLGGCGQDRFEAYCERVEEHQVALTEAVAQGGPDALLDVLPRLQELSEAAPRDVADEWQQVVGRLEALEASMNAWLTSLEDGRGIQLRAGQGRWSRAAGTEISHRQVLAA